MINGVFAMTAPDDVSTSTLADVERLGAGKAARVER
jgi:hypothetical protein